MKLYAFADEASPTVDGQIAALKRSRLDGLEIRGTDQGNVSAIPESYAREIARKLEDNGLFGDCLNCPCNLGSCFGRCAETHSAAVNIRAGNIYFKPADLLFLIKFFAGVGIVFNGKTADICHYGL